MNCPRCHTSLVADAHFCGVCGLSLPATNGSSPEASSPASNPSLDDATYVVPWPDNRFAQSLQAQPDSEPTVRQYPPASTQPIGWHGGQTANGLPANQPAAWSQQQQPPANWAPPIAQFPVMAPGAINSPAQTPKKPRRLGGCLLRVFLVLVLLAAVLVGAWFLALRPYLHNIAQTQLNQALNDAEGQILLFQTAIPAGTQTISASESDINSYLTTHTSGQLQNLHMTITPANIRLDFSVYGFGSTITVVPVASGGALSVTDVHVQGVLWLVMSNAELTSALNSSFQQFGHQMNRTIQKVTLHTQEIDIKLH
jgi:hypothetical protein